MEKIITKCLEHKSVASMSWLLSKDEAIILAKSRFHEKLTYKQRAYAQLMQDRVFMPFDIFRESLEVSLGRPVWIHELALNRQGLIDELVGKIGAPSFEQIIEPIKEKAILVLTEESEESLKCCAWVRHTANIEMRLNLKP